MDQKVFPLTVHETYYKTGFFNVPVAFDRCVNRSEGPIKIVVGDEQRQIEGKINRTANLNGTPRIMGGTPLRDWFQHNCKEGDTVTVDLSSFREIRNTK